MRKTFLTFGRRALRLALLTLVFQAQTCAGADAGENAIDVSAVGIADILGNVRGGLQRGARFLNKADLLAAYLGDDRGNPGLSFFLDVQATDATTFNGAVVGAAQDVSNIDAPAGLRLADAWIARDFNGMAGFKAGIVDLNTEFDVQTTGALFLNSAFGIGPDFSQSGENGPSIFPSTGLGLAGWWLPGGHWQLKAGLFEGAPGDSVHPGRTFFSISGNEGALLVLEARNHLTPDFVIGAGVWRYTASFDAIDPAAGRLPGNSGFYAIADGLLYAAPEGEKSGLSGWVRVGFADDRINAINVTAGGGLVYTAPFGRSADQAGISLSRAQFGAPARRVARTQGTGLDAAETAVEATYSLALNDRLTVQPDIQYVFSPGGDLALRNAVIVGSRFTVAW